MNEAETIHEMHAALAADLSESVSMTVASDSGVQLRPRTSLPAGGPWMPNFREMCVGLSFKRFGWFEHVEWATPPSFAERCGSRSHQILGIPYDAERDD